MLTCFTLQNVVRGLLILASDVFRQSVDMKTLIVKVEGADSTKIEEF
jgi:hypothetical protein